MAERLEITRLQAIIELYKAHHANCFLISQENNNLLQQGLSNLGGDLHAAQIMPPSVDEDNLQVVISGPDNRKRKRHEQSMDPSPNIRKENKNTNNLYARRKLIANVADVEDVVIQPLSIFATSAGTDTPFARGMVYAQRTRKTISEYHEKEIQARVELFIFSSCCAVLEILSVLTRDQADQLMSTLAVSDSSDFFQRIRTGAAYLNKALVSGLVKKGLHLAEATALIARSAPARPYWYTRIKNTRHTVSLVEQLHEHQSSWKESRNFCLVSEYVLQWHPNLKLDQIHRALGYPNIDNDRENPHLSPTPDPPSSLQVISPIAPLLHGGADGEGSSVVQGSQLNQLLGLLTALGSQHNIPETLLSEAGYYRKRWTADGDLLTFRAEDIGLDPLVASMLRDHRLLAEGLSKLESDGFLTRNSEGIKMLQSPNIGRSDQEQAIVLACFFFTGCEYSRKFSAIGTAALPLFQDAFQQYKGLNQDQRSLIRPQVLQALLQASKFADLGWKKKCLCFMEEMGLEILDLPSQASFVLRKSFVLRADGQWEESSTVLCRFMQTFNPSNKQLNAIRGLLIYSLASNLWERENFIEAEKQLCAWAPMEYMQPSLYETRTFVRILTGSALVSMHQGHFTQARDFLQRARAQYDPESRALLDVTASLADVFCELGESLKALELLEPIINQGVCLTDRYRRNCFISYAEASICLSKHEPAEKVLMALKKHYETSQDLDRHDQRRYNRILVLLAQTLHRQADSIQKWQEAGERWEDVARCMQEFEETSNWDFAMICFSIHHTLIARGKSSEWYARGAAELKKKVISGCEV